MPNPHLALAVLNVRVNLTQVCDLTDSTPGGNQDQLGTTAQELTGDWDGYHVRNVLAPTNVSGPTGIAPTQELGQALSHAGVEGILTVSAKIPTNRNLAVLPGNLLSGSSVEFSDPRRKPTPSDPVSAPAKSLQVAIPPVSDDQRTTAEY